MFESRTGSFVESETQSELHNAGQDRNNTDIEGQLSSPIAYGGFCENAVRGIGQDHSHEEQNSAQKNSEEQPPGFTFVSLFGSCVQIFRVNVDILEVSVFLDEV